MNLKVENFTKSERIECKRFYFPAQITGECHCGAPIKRDFTEDYLSYPCINDIETVYLVCENDHETEVNIRLKVEIELENF